ncbi:MAG: PH domain-containing protein [Acidobacteriota bacterium]|nr:PH domain-containing protein [Acidobacteriota bacterium]
MSKSYRAPWSRRLTSLSIGVTILLVGVTFLVWRAASTVDSWALGLAVATPLVIMLASVLFTIRGYEVDGALLRIRRLLWWTTVGLDGLRSVEPNPLAMKRSLRLFGNGGLYSFSGLFRSKELGKYRAFVTDPARAVVLKLSDRTVVVSPEEPEVFSRQLRELRRLPGPTSSQTM